MTSPYRIERERGTKESPQQIAVLREKWPLAFPVKDQDVRPLAIGAGSPAETVDAEAKDLVPIDDRRRRLPTGEPYPRGVVVRLPLPAGNRALEAERPARDSSGDRLTPIDYIAVILLFLSTLTGPVLVWALVSF